MSKLLPRGDGPFQVVAKVNDNAYKLDLPGEYNVSATFNVSDLTPYDDSADLRTNPFQEGGDDVSTFEPTQKSDPEVLPQGPITRSKAKQFKEALSLTCAKLSYSFDNVCALDSRLYNVLHADISFQFNEATTPSASSNQLPSALLAQLKLNNSEVAETRPTCGRVSHELKDTSAHLKAAQNRAAHWMHTSAPWQPIGVHGSVPWQPLGRAPCSPQQQPP
ncbi:hypothetical protein V6N11_021617 [Hibiscus sabdariffa]|uniref:Tf2-1-like SH3-like domain-containing protein n=1 Tax=Hibiscus sabdariffa TaxID=183260 RepID=A0ABR2PBD6_9ROSI